MHTGGGKIEIDAYYLFATPEQVKGKVYSSRRAARAPLV